jgi:DNA-binding NtrC family response regulator
MTRKRALVVDDSEDMRELIKATLPDYAFQACGSLRCALNYLSAHRYELIVLDLALEDSRPEQTVASLAGFMALVGDAAVVVMTGHPSAIEGKLIPADALLRKPFTTQQLDDAVALATQNNSPTRSRPLTTLLLAATRAAIGPAVFSIRRHASAI